MCMYTVCAHVCNVLRLLLYIYTVHVHVHNTGVIATIFDVHVYLHVQTVFVHVKQSIKTPYSLKSI